MFYHTAKHVSSVRAALHRQVKNCRCYDRSPCQSKCCLSEERILHTNSTMRILKNALSCNDTIIWLTGTWRWKERAERIYGVKKNGVNWYQVTFIRSFLRQRTRVQSWDTAHAWPIVPFISHGDLNEIWYWRYRTVKCQENVILVYIRSYMEFNEKLTIVFKQETSRS
jgi:hypothetical protein